MSNRHLPMVGISNVGFPTPVKNGIEFFEDFENWSTSDISATALTAPWRAVGTNALAADFDSLNAVAADGEVFGLQQIALSSGAAGDESIAQSIATFPCRANRVMSFVVRFRAESITTCGHLFGMYIPDADPWTQVNGFGFRIVNGAISYEVKDAGTTLAATSTGATITASSTTGWVTLEAIWDGQAAIRFYKDRVLLATYTGNAIPTDLNLSITYGIGATASVNPTVTLDYIGCSVEGSPAGR